MSEKRKILLLATISVIVVCYGFALYSIMNHTAIKNHQAFQLPNGSSPLNCCFGEGVYSGNANLTIKNGASSDAIVCLYSINSKRTIRNAYVQKNTSYTITNIAEDSYKIRVLYGNDWDPELENPYGKNGFFKTDIYFSEFDGTQEFEDGYYGYTVATITLYTVSNGNASTSKISQSEFFNN